MKNTLETRLGLFFALALVAGVVLLEMIGTPDFFKSGDIVQARFNTIQELKVGDPVKMAGVEIGRVRGIHLFDAKDLALHRHGDVRTPKAECHM